MLAVVMAGGPARADAPDVVIGVLLPLSGGSASVGLDDRHALEVAAELINGIHDLDLPLAKSAGLPHLGGAKVKLVFADHQGDPQKGRAEAERLVTEEKAVALLGAYQSAVSATIAQVAENYSVPFLCADSTSPSLTKRGFQWFFRTTAQDEMFSQALFDFLDAMAQKTGRKPSVALISEDTLFGTDSSTALKKLADDRGYTVAANIKYRANSPSLTSEVQQLKASQAEVVLPSSYTSDAILMTKTMAELGYRPQIVAQAAGFSDQATLDAIGPLADGIVSRSSFSVDLAPRRPAIPAVNDMYKKLAGKDLNDNTARDLMGLLVLADAIDRAGSTDHEKLRQALIATDFPGAQTIMPWKRVHFDESGQNVDASPLVLQYGEGQWHTVFPLDVAARPAVWNAGK